MILLSFPGCGRLLREARRAGEDASDLRHAVLLQAPHFRRRQIAALPENEGARRVDWSVPAFDLFLYFSPFLFSSLQLIYLKQVLNYFPSLTCSRKTTLSRFKWPSLCTSFYFSQQFHEMIAMKLIDGSIGLERRSQM